MLVLVAVIFIPMVLDDSIQNENEITGTNIPERPKGEFDSRIVPVQESDLKQIPPLLTEEAETKSIKSESAADNISNEVVQDKQSAAIEDKEDNVAKKSNQNASTVILDKAPEKQSVKTEQDRTPSSDISLKQTDTVKKGLTAWVVQLGSFSSQENANTLTEKLRKAGYPAFVEPLKSGSQTVYRVRVGPELLRSDAQALQDKLDKEFQQKGLILRYP